MYESLASWCHRNDREDLLAQWHPEKNGDISPDTISYGSKKKVWWRCEKGHEWLAMVYTRSTAAARCPYCVGLRPWPGENDLTTKMPDLAAQWHPEKNGALSPRDVACGCNRKVWWRCEEGHEWQATVHSRSQGVGCPVCSNHSVAVSVNDLATTHPHLAAQWHPEKNGSLRPQDFVAGSRRKVWWICDKGHEWQAIISSRACRGSDCPVCGGKSVLAGENDLATLYPSLAAQWHPENNGVLKPDQVTPYSNRKVWWRCEEGHEWQATVASRSSKSAGCPVCSGRKVQPGFNDLATLHPQIAAQWDKELNGSLRPDMVTAGSAKKVWWRCEEGHVWKSIIYSRTGKRKHGCPLCAGNVKKMRNK